jgi:hypothetical protein
MSSPRWRRLDRGLRSLRYLVLAAILWLTASAGTLVFEGYDPFKVLFHFKLETTAGVVVLVLLLSSSLLVERFWCKYLCPLGAVVSLAARISPAGIVRSSSSCVDCGRCDRACGLGLEVSSKDQVSSGQCSLCGECVSACSRPSALKLTWLGRPPGARWTGRSSLSSSLSGLRPLVAVALFALLLVTASATGFWNSRAEAGQADGHEPSATAAAATPSEQGEPSTAASVKGRMTAAEVSTAFAVPVEDVLAALGAPGDYDPAQSIKAIAAKHGGTVEDLRSWLSEKEDQEE